MGRSYFLTTLLVFSVLSMCFCQGCGRKLKTHEGTSFVLQGKTEFPRDMMEAMDYEDPGANTNPRTGYFLTPPFPSPPTSSPTSPPPEGSDF